MKYYIYGCTDTGSGREINKGAVLVGGKVFSEGGADNACEAPFIAAIAYGVGARECLRKLNGGEADISAEGGVDSLFIINADDTGACTLVTSGGGAAYRFVNGAAHSFKCEASATPIGDDFGSEPDDMLMISTNDFAKFVSEKDIQRAMDLDLPVSEKLNALSRVAALNGCKEDISIIGVKPYIEDAELEALTAYSIMQERVNVNDILHENDALSSILDIDVNEIIGKKKKPEPTPVKKAAPVKVESLELEFHDLFMQAQASLSKLENMFDNKKRK